MVSRRAPRDAVTPIRVLLADDHALVRAGLRSLLDRVSDIEVVGEAADGHEAVARARTMTPDVLLMDIAMPGLNGLEAAARIRGERPDVRIILLSMHANEEYVMRALQIGASGYLLKDAAAPELVVAIRTVMGGGTHLSPGVSSVLVEDYARRVGGSRSLTPRQRDILRRIAEGASTKEMAYALGISVKTVESHRSHIMKRLDLHDVASLVRYAIRAGLVSPDA